MDQLSGNPEAVRFAGFEVDFRSGEVRKGGVKIRLEGQPFQVLTLLLKNAGAVVTRQELKNELWSKDTFVDFDNGVNAAIKRIRRVLNDSATSPRYIETLPRHGYRFVAAVEPIGPKRQPAHVQDVQSEQPAALGPRGLEIRKLKRQRVGLLLTMALVVAGLAVDRFHEAQPEGSAVLRFSLTTPENVQNPAISPNGRHVAYIAGEGAALWVQDLDEDEPRRLAGTEGARLPFWSPDSEWLGFAVGSVLTKVALEGGTLIPLHEMATDDFYGASWSPDGKTIAFKELGVTSQTVLVQTVPADGGPIQTIEGPNGTKGSRHPVFLPTDSGRFLLTEERIPEYEIVLYDLDANTRKVLGKGRRAVYSPTGHLIYETAEAAPSIWALPFSLKGPEVIGEPFPVANGGSNPSVSGDGTLVYLAENAGTENELVWIDRRGNILGTIGKSQSDQKWVNLSPDGRWVSVSAVANGNRDIWLHSTGRPPVTKRLTFQPGRDMSHAWSPSSEALAFNSQEQPILVKAADGSLPPKPLVSAEGVLHDWSPDGKHVIYHSDGSVWYTKVDSHEKKSQTVKFLKGPRAGVATKFSPDGRFVVYASSRQSGRYEVYVRSFPDGEGLWQVSHDGGIQPRWSRDGNEIFYVEDDTLISVDVRSNPTFSIGTRRKLFRLSRFSGSFFPLYDVSADGRRFVILKPIGPENQPVIRVVQNWYEEFRDRQRD